MFLQYKAAVHQWLGEVFSHRYVSMSGHWAVKSQELHAGIMIHPKYNLITYPALSVCPLHTEGYNDYNKINTLMMSTCKR